MLIIELHEREARVFPRGELFDNQGQSKLFASTRSLSVVELRDVADGVELRALGLIGFLPLTATITLNIRPKFSLTNLWHLLSVADESYDRLLPVLRSYEAATGGAPHHLLIRSFCHYLAPIIQQGVARGYYNFEHRGHYKPKVNIGRTIGTFASRGDGIKVVSDAVAFSANLRANGILRSACSDFLRLIPAAPQWAKERALISDALNTLQNVTPVRMQPRDVHCAEELQSWLRPGYSGALSAYSVLLGFTKIGFGYAVQGTKLPSFLFSLDAIFESFIRNTFRKAYKDLGIAILDGNKPANQKPLFKDNRKFPVKPDLIFRRAGNVLALGEVKYKPKIEEGDRYQLISHAIAHQAQIGAWISPSVNGKSELEFAGTTGGTRFYHYRFNLSAELSTEQKLMVDAIAALLPPA